MKPRKVHKLTRGQLWMLAALFDLDAGVEYLDECRGDSYGDILRARPRAWWVALDEDAEDDEPYLILDSLTNDSEWCGVTRDFLLRAGALSVDKYRYAFVSKARKPKRRK